MRTKSHITQQIVTLEDGEGRTILQAVGTGRYWTLTAPASDTANAFNVTLLEPVERVQEFMSVLGLALQERYKIA